MPTNINTFKLFVEFVQNKVQVGNSVTVDQFNLVANQAQYVVFEKDYQTFLKTDEISEFLQFFFKTVQASVPSSGIYNLPSDFQHSAALRKYYVSSDGVGKMIAIDEINAVAWGLAQISQLMKPSFRFPKYNNLAQTLRFLPRNIGLIEMDYFSTPTAPVWAYTTVNNRPVYDAANSVNFVWDTFALNNVAAIYLSLIGCNLKDNELLNFSQMYQAETNSVL